MICKTCYSPIPDNAKICPNCNTTIEPITQLSAESYNNTPTPKKTFWKTDKASGLGVFITILLSLCLFFTSFATLSLLNIKSTLSTKGIANIIEDLFEDISITEIIESTELKHQLTDIEEILKTEYGAKVPPKTIEKILNHSSVTDFFAQKTSIFLVDCFEKDYAELIINGDHIYELLIENQDALHDEIDITLTPEQIRNAIDKTIGDNEHVIMTSTTIKENKSVNSIFETANKVLDIMNLYFTDLSIIILLVINLLIIFIMVKIHLPKGITAAAVPIIIVSVLYIVIGTALVPLLLSMVGDFEGSAIVTKLINNLFATSTTISIILLVVSIGSLIIKAIKFKKKYN